MLTAISPIDGRYRRGTAALADYFSEYALIKYRLWVEVEYLIALSELPQLPLAAVFEQQPNWREALRQICTRFTPDEAQKVKDIEKTTNHDVKAVEYYLKSQLPQGIVAQYAEWVHFGLTSQDINNTAIPLSLRAFFAEQYQPAFAQLTGVLDDLSQRWADVPMLSRTHGQPASPTLLGKEIAVFAERLRGQFAQLEAVPYSAKFGGAVGNFNAHYAAYPQVDWHDFAQHLLLGWGLKRSYPTTQIEPYDNIAAMCHAYARINTILIDCCRDMWTYISLDYFKQKIVAGEVGSSAMPHKVNPIDFENAEGNFGIANALFEHFAAKLPISRLQRDLTDSTVLRNIGVPLAHTIIGINSLQKGLGKLLLNKTALQRDLDQHWEVLAEAIQTILRCEQYEQPYEALKALTRNHERVTPDLLHQFIKQLPINNALKAELEQLTPFNYTGRWR